METKIYPTETGYVISETIDIGRNGGHIQGITQLGDEYTLLSSDYDTQELIVAHGVGSRKKVVLDQAIPNEYKHAGGIDALQIEKNRWMIVVPVHYDKNREGKLEFQRARSRWRIKKSTTDSQDKGAILHYFFSLKNGTCKLELYHITELKGVKAYAAGIARNGSSLVVAVVIDNDGRQVLFLKCNNLKGEGKYCYLDVWKEEENEDTYWGHYDNSISLINYDNDYGKIYFVGLDGQTVGKFDRDLIDIYSVEIQDQTVNLEKEQQFHAICTEAPSFRWGGNARIHNGKVEILSVEKDVKKNDNAQYIRYDKFHLDIDNDANKLQLKPTIEIGEITIS